MDKNMRLKPFHLGNHQGHRYMINIEDIQAHPIDEKVANFLQHLIDNGDSFSRSQNKEQLQALGLLSPKNKNTTQKAQKYPAPIVNAAFFLTQSCNLRCIYCYGEGGEYGHKSVHYIANDKEKLTDAVASTIQRGDLVLTLGAGDISSWNDVLVDKWRQRVENRS